ncbi:polyphenol oxidase family protein [Candidatus Poriferisodalis sp.]|uniref:polyphenol oxidase family protein n=1 Tax=Candidatus Poriferisodalis sp. TaxID=3101277 RepID=UPI003B0145E3
MRISISERTDGDCAPTDGSSGAMTTVLRQVHGCHVLRVDQPGDHLGACADAAWTTTPGAMLAVRTADCVPVALYGHDASGRGAVAAAHAGWRGLLAGVVEAVLTELAGHGFGHIRAVVGPHICSAHYEFEAADLAQAVTTLGSSVAGATAWDTPSLDLAEGVRLALRRGNAVVDTELGRCTASDTRYFSHRTRAERGRTALLVCLDGDAAPGETGD